MSHESRRSTPAAASPMCMYLATRAGVCHITRFGFTPQEGTGASNAWKSGRRLIFGAGVACVFSRATTIARPSFPKTGRDGAALGRVGGRAVHLVDLDGAARGPAGESTERAGDSRGRRRAMRARRRNPERTDDLRSLGPGSDALVLGTVAIRQPDWFRQMCRKFPGRLVLGIDAREGYVATEGWLQTSKVRATELARDLPPNRSRRSFIPILPPTGCWRE